jgi:hypothetical protein
LEALVVGIMFVYRTVKVRHLKRNEEFKTPAPAYILYIEEPLYLPHRNALFFVTAFQVYLNPLYNVMTNMEQRRPSLKGYYH